MLQLEKSDEFKNTKKPDSEQGGYMIKNHSRNYHKKKELFKSNLTPLYTKK